MIVDPTAPCYLRRGLHESRVFRFTSGKKSKRVLNQASLQSTGAQRIGSQEQVQHENAKSNTGTNAYTTAAHTSNNVTNYYSVSPHREPQPLATPDGLQPWPGGWQNHDTQALET